MTEALAGTSIKRAFARNQNPVCICYASNDAFSEYLYITLYSLITHADSSRCLDILVMTSDIREQNRKRISALSNLRKDISIRFIDMQEYAERVNTVRGMFYTKETNYRLFLLSPLFAEYDRILYLDVDTLACDDICKLYDMELGEAPVGASRDFGIMLERYYQNALIWNKQVFSIETYCKDVIMLPSHERYFNAGVLLMSLPKLRKRADERRAISLLTENRFIYNDQDVLNTIVKGQYYDIGTEWDYLNAYEVDLNGRGEKLKTLYDGIKGPPRLIHYVGGRKPWNTEKVCLGEFYQEEARKAIEYIRKEEKNV